MTKYFSSAILILFLCLSSSDLFSQYKLPFGDIGLVDLSNKPYKPDPGADAIILSDIGVASFNYVNEFYVEFERDVKIRIVNSEGFDYANIEIPYTSDDRIYNYRASTFNTRNGERTETKIPKKSFLTENKSSTTKVLRFNFPDVHEGSIIEYSYIIRLTKGSIYTLVPWRFQSLIPTVLSSLTVTYPEACRYKSIISGSAINVSVSNAKSEGFIFGERGYIITTKWTAQNMPAFREEPYIKSRKEHITRVSFELGSIDFKGSGYEEITPSYATLTTKLLERNDFGKALNTNFKSIAEKITVGMTDNLLKLKKIHEYISTNILWNGENDYTASGTLRTVFNKGKGNSADINLILISMLRSVNINADPLILSTRSNGSLNQFSAMIQQFDYLVAYVNIGGDIYLVDATDPLRSFDVLPFDCLNDAGRLINTYDSKFVNLRNKETSNSSTTMILNLDLSGNLEGSLENRYSDYMAYSIRKLIKNEGEEGYIDLMKSSSSDVDFSDVTIEYANNRDSDLIEKGKVKIVSGVEIAGNEIIFSPDLSLTRTKNPFTALERKFPVDFGSPFTSTSSLTINIPQGYAVVEKPGDITLNLGDHDGNFAFKCIQIDNKLVISYIININKTVFKPSEYNELKSFYSKILKKQAELLILKRNAMNS